MMSPISVIIVAAGKGRRLGYKIPKAFIKLAGQEMYRYSLETFSRIAEIGQLVLVVPRGWPERLSYLRSSFPKLGAVVAGGRERSDSVRAGLEAVSERSDLVLIHDAARPLVSARDIRAVIAAAKRSGAAVLAQPVTDTIKRGRRGFIAATVDRHDLWRAQTPQGFHRRILRRIYACRGTDVTDDSSLAERAGFRVALVPASSPNFKITDKHDLWMAACLLRKNRRA